MNFRPVSPPLIGLLLLLALAWLAYAPGLHGAFLFDDFGNLPVLGASGPVDNWATFFRYITAGSADPTGRPLALLSFLFDARDWPAAPYPFKRTNLILHLLNGVLLTLLLRQLGREQLASADNYRSDLAAVLGAAFWLLHPLLVSTTLYIVQREAMLATSFTLLGLLLWLHGRHTILHGRPRRGMCWIAFGLGGCTALAVLCKANGVLLPSLALIVEYVWLRHCNRKGCPQRIAFALRPIQMPPIYRWGMLLFTGLPSLLLGVYLVHAGWSGFVYGVSALRPWTMGQRLLTEPRVMMSYLDLLWLPRPFTPGIFNDQIAASASLWSPATTLPALLGVLGLIVGAWALRTRFPALALAMLFYFVGQAMESTTLQLELYFEHRNYLPTILMFWPLAMWLLDTAPRHREIVAARPPWNLRLSNARWKLWMKGALALGLLCGLALMTHVRASLWGNANDQALIWAQRNPGSPRAQTNAALLEMAARDPRQAIARLKTALHASPEQVQLSFHLIDAQCMLGRVAASDFELARRSISRTRDPGNLLTQWFDENIQAAVEGRCRGLDLTALDSLLDAGLANPKLVDVDGRHQDLIYLKGRIALARHNPDAALYEFNSALDLDVRAAAALNQAALLGAAGYPQKGLNHLNHFCTLHVPPPRLSSGMPWLHAWVLLRQDYWPKEIQQLRDTLQHDTQAKVVNHK